MAATEKSTASLPPPQATKPNNHADSGTVTSLVRIDTKDHWVPTAHADHSVTAIGNMPKVRLIVGDWVVARDTRD